MMTLGLVSGTACVNFLASRALAANATYQLDDDCAHFEEKCMSNEP